MEKLEMQDRANTIIKEHDGIFPPFNAFYVHSILYAANQAAKAFERYELAVNERQDPETIFSEVQEGLLHSAALSRFFWPGGKVGALSRTRGANLRRKFDLEENSPLRDRQLRNAFEHFDEYLDQFLLENEIGSFFPTPMVADHTLADDQLGNIFKLVDPAHQICVLLGKKFEFYPIRVEVNKVLKKGWNAD